MVKNSAACGRVLAYSAYYIAEDIVYHIALFVAQTYCFTHRFYCKDRRLLS
jgi:hypothetical protein